MYVISLHLDISKWSHTGPLLQKFVQLVLLHNGKWNPRVPVSYLYDFFLVVLGHQQAQY